MTKDIRQERPGLGAVAVGTAAGAVLGASAGAIVAASTVARLNTLAAVDQVTVSPSDVSLAWLLTVVISGLSGAIVGTVTAAMALLGVRVSTRAGAGPRTRIAVAGVTVLVVPVLVWWPLAFWWTDPVLWFPYVAGGALLAAVTVSFVVARPAARRERRPR